MKKENQTRPSVDRTGERKPSFTTFALVALIIIALVVLAIALDQNRFTAVMPIITGFLLILLTKIGLDSTSNKNTNDEN